MKKDTSRTISVCISINEHLPYGENPKVVATKKEVTGQFKAKELKSRFSGLLTEARTEINALIADLEEEEINQEDTEA